MRNEALGPSRFVEVDDLALIQLAAQLVKWPQLTVRSAVAPEGPAVRQGPRQRRSPGGDCARRIADG